MIKNDRFLKALRREPVDVTPIWIMRQAGRYLPEYRKVRASVPGFMTLCKTPELAAEVTIQPLRRFELDAAIIFSDILTIPAAMGLDLKFVEGEGPQFSNPIQNLRDIQALKTPDPAKDLKYVGDAIRLTKPEIQVPLIGFSGSPWTLAAYMIEGHGSSDFARAKQFLYSEPAALHTLLNHLAKAVILYLQSQIEAGADAVMIFDTWGGLLTTPCYREFSLNYMQQIIEGVKAYSNTPIIVFTKNGGQWLESIADSGCDAMGLDWTCSLQSARERVGHRVALQGNLDPALLRTSPEIIVQHAQGIIKEMQGHAGHIFNLGHGITPNIPVEHVQALVEAVHGADYSGVHSRTVTTKREYVPQ